MEFPVKVNDLNITNLFAGSLCKVNILAVYNPARVDPGLDIMFGTLSSRRSRSCSIVHTYT